MRGKELELEQAAEAYRNIQWLKQQSEEKEKKLVREKDAIINQLQAALQARSQETQVTRIYHRLPLLWPPNRSQIHVDKPVLPVFSFITTTGVLTMLFFFFYVCSFVNMCRI